MGFFSLISHFFFIIIIQTSVTREQSTEREDYYFNTEGACIKTKRYFYNINYSNEIETITMF